MSDPSDPGMPRWVKVSGIIAIVLVVLFVVVLLVGGGHGPGRHTSSGDPARSTGSHAVAGPTR